MENKKLKKSLDSGKIKINHQTLTLKKLKEKKMKLLNSFKDITQKKLKLQKQIT